MILRLWQTEFQPERSESTCLQLITTLQFPKIPVRVNNKTSASMIDVKRTRKNHHNLINTGCSFILFPAHLMLASPAHQIREPVTELLQVLHLISCDISSKPRIYSDFSIPQEPFVDLRGSGSEPVWVQLKTQSFQNGTFRWHQPPHLLQGHCWKVFHAVWGSKLEFLLNMRITQNHS